MYIVYVRTFHSRARHELFSREDYKMATGVSMKKIVEANCSDFRRQK